jgi:glycosyltransferase involved in cell wall biosynthesis
MSVGRPLISVVVPTKGRVRSLERCLEALKRTDYDRERFEVVVSNDRGMQEVESLVAAFGDRLRVSTTMPERSGPSAARNAGAAAASGEYVAFTDDDCEPESGWLSALERSLVANPGAAAGGTVRNGAAQNLGAVATQAVVDALHAGFNRDPGAPRFFASSNVAFPSRGFRSVGGFDENERYAEDRDLCERWIAAGNRFVSTPDAVVVHMRTLDLSQFMGQHYGYGRGAFAFNGMQSERRGGDRMAVLEGLARESLRRHDGHSRAALAAYLLLSQLATAAGFVREAVARSIVRARS